MLRYGELRLQGEVLTVFVVPLNRAIVLWVVARVSTSLKQAETNKASS